MLEYVLVGAVGVIVVVYLYGAVYISYCVVRSAMFESWQKIIIVLVSWLLPIVGPAFIYRLLEDEISSTRLTRLPLVPFIFLSSDVSWSYGKGSHTEPHSNTSDSGGSES